MDCTEGEARRIDDSYVSSVSGAHRDSRIEGLEGLAVRREGVRVLGVDSVIEGNNDVVGSESGAPMGEGPGKGGTADLTDLAEVTGDEGAGEGLNTDAGRGMSLAIIVVDIDGVLSMSEGALVVGEPRGYKGNSRSM
jgi:hypothetical protein